MARWWRPKTTRARPRQIVSVTCKVESLCALITDRPGSPVHNSKINFLFPSYVRSYSTPLDTLLIPHTTVPFRRTTWHPVFPDKPYTYFSYPLVQYSTFRVSHVIDNLAAAWPMRVHSFPPAPSLSLEQYPLEASVSRTNMYDLTLLSDDRNLVFSFSLLILACHYLFCLLLVTTKKLDAKPSRWAVVRLPFLSLAEYQQYVSSTSVD
jgi:hypothetical protein